MSRRQKAPRRSLNDAERTALARLSRSPSAPAAQVARARALLAVAEGQSYTTAAALVGRPYRRYGRALGSVASFNRDGLAAVVPRPGGGPSSVGRPGATPRPGRRGHDRRPRSRHPARDAVHGVADRDRVGDGAAARSGAALPGPDPDGGGRSRPVPGRGRRCDRVGRDCVFAGRLRRRDRHQLGFQLRRRCERVQRGRQRLRQSARFPGAALAS